MSIYTEQNKEGMLLLNKTRKCLYSKAKIISSIRTASITIITCIFVVLTSILESKILNALSVVFGIVSFIASFIIDKYINDIKWLAAGIQQRFDSHIFELDCNILAYSLLGLDFPSREQIIKYVNRFKNKEVDNLQNWYNDYSNLSKSNQILCCQKENFRWETTLKKKYICLYIVYYAVLVLALIIIGIFTNDIFKIFSIYTWVLPISQQAFTSFSRLVKDIKRLDNIHKQISYADSLKTDEEALFRQVCNLQALIYEHRIKGSMVPDFIYKIYRKKLQGDELAISEDLNNN